MGESLLISPKVVFEKFLQPSPSGSAGILKLQDVGLLNYYYKLTR